MTGTELATMVNSILSQQWLWGVILGATLTYFSQRFQILRQRKDEQKIASMQVATLLRCWLADCESAVLDYENWVSTDGQMGRNLCEIPDLNIEQSLDQIVRLKLREAKATFELIQNMKDTERSFVFAVNVLGGEEATDILHNKCGVLFIDGLNIYKQLVKQLGWEMPFSEQLINKMTGLADRSSRSEQKTPNSRASVERRSDTTETAQPD